MPKPSPGIVEYRGKRGVVWRIKYRDADGRQIMETVGPESEGVTRKQAEAALRGRVVKVEQKGWRKPAPLTFREYADEWVKAGPVTRGWKPATQIKYRSVLRRLNETFGPMPLQAIRPRDVSAYTTAKLETFAAKTINLDLNVLADIFKTAIAEEVAETNPVSGVQRPKVRRRKWKILTPAEVTRVAQAFTDAQAQLIFLTLVLTGVRRFELPGLRWRNVDLVLSNIRIVESKSEEGERSIALSPMLAEALWQRRRSTAFQGDDELVFCHPKRGSKIDHEWYAAEFRKALKAAGVTEYVRPFHDLRHASLTNGVVAGEQPLELMARAGHRSMSTTRQYLHLAGITFPEKAAALEQHLLSGRTFYRSEMIPADVAAPEAHEHAVTAPD
jgi:integrase